MTERRFENIEEELYFKYLFDTISYNSDFDPYQYSLVIEQLYFTPFRICKSVPRDANRATDGIDLRDRFNYETGRHYCSCKSCNVLEMMVALAIRCEEDIMGDLRTEDRTSRWFWIMVQNLGILMNNDSYSEGSVARALNRFLDRLYSADGSGGLFAIPGCAEDLTTIEIWYQLMWYLNYIS